MSDRSAANPIAAIAVALGLTGLGLYLVAGQELARMIILVLQVGGVTVIVGLVAVTFIGLGYAVWVAYQRGQTALEARLAAAARRQIIEAQALRERREAEVLVVTARADEQIFIRDTAHGLWRAGHLDPRIYANGLPSLPSGLELAAWQTFHRPVAAPGSPALAEPPALAAGLWPPQVNLLDLLPDGGALLEQVVLGVTLGPTGLEPMTAPLAGLVHIAIGGSSGWGKSMLLRALAFQLLLAPEACQLVFIDLEGVTFSPFERCDRLRYRVADTEQTALDVLADLLDDCCHSPSYDLLRLQPHPQGQGLICQHWKDGLLDILHREGLVALELKAGERKPTLQVWRLLPLLTPGQYARLNSQLQTDYDAWLEQYGSLFGLADRPTWAAITEASLAPLMPGYKQAQVSDNFAQRRKKQEFLRQAVLNPGFNSGVTQNQD